MSKLIRILIADDHQLVRQGFVALLSVKPGVEVIGQAEDGVEAVKLAHSLKPDIILMDLLMPNKNGIEATREIKA
ncbi:MAG: response regulator transcription factor, partial [bacterium]|nr:response regulator transcription factor [bacterium]